LNPIRVTVHRSTQEIGGNCVEIASGDARIILDVGRPLDAARDATDLLAPTLDLAAPCHGILLSHAHQDHYGLLGEIPADWPVYCGEATAKLMRLTSGMFGKELDRDFRPCTSGRAFSIGPFTVTPYLTDHSAFDAYMLLVDAAGRRILYSGDFRAHGRKGALVSRFLEAPPGDIDLLVMEGTNLGSDKPWMSEADLEEDFVGVFQKTPGRVFVAWSAQNIDRTVTLYRACLKAGRTLVVDLYTAEVMELLAGHGKLPRPGWRNLKVVVTRAFSRLYRMKGRTDFVDRMAHHGIAARRLAETPYAWVVMARKSLLRDYETVGVIPGPQDAWSWSMWRGYLADGDGANVKAWFDAGGTPARHIHTGGHAAPDDLRAFARAVNAKAMAPIHGSAWDKPHDGFPAITRLRDGQALFL